MAAALDSDKILRALHAQWDDLDRQNADTGGVLRACSLTLVATAADPDDAAALRRTLGMLVRDHPLRAIVLRTHSESETAAQVFSECWLPNGAGQHICSEGVEIATSPANLESTAPILLALREADLPVVLCCRGPAAFTLRAYDALFPLADKIILDSSAAPGASAALAFLRSLRARGYRVADLHWTRLTGWREILSHLFDGEAVAAANVTAARVIHGGETASTCALYFASWIRRALPAAKVSLERASLETASPEGAPPGKGLRSVTFSSPQGEISLALAGPRLVEVNVPGRSYRVPLPPSDEESLLREELNILGPDPVYDRVLG
jgi:glucose-6-phosphate dehydrogenase assembly protein OpcA